MTDASFATIDWSDCPLVMPEPEGGDWLVMQSAPRASVQGLILNHLDGESVEDVAYMFDCPVDEARAIIRYYTDRASKARLAR